MAKLVIAGNALVITSECVLDDIKTLEKYSPKALSLFDAKEEEYFRVGTGAGSVSKYGVSFDSESRLGNGKACITVVLPEVDDVVKYVADEFGATLINLNAVENQINSAVMEVMVQKAQIIDSIETIA